MFLDSQFHLTFKVPIKTATDDTFYDTFLDSWGIRLGMSRVPLNIKPFLEFRSNNKKNKVSSAVKLCQRFKGQIYFTLV